MSSIGVAIASYNRRERLLETLGLIANDFDLANAPIVVIDNASSDGTAMAVEKRFPRVTIHRRDSNDGVEGYNDAVARLKTDYVLVLDDDACPEPGAIRGALACLAARPEVGAVALNPVDALGMSEFPLRSDDSGMRERWPLLIAGFVVRRADWMRVQGFEGSFFLYVNDTDLALKLLASKRQIVLDPSLRVQHFSPTSQRRPPAWFHLAARNRVWLIRRHAGLLPGAPLVVLALADIGRRGLGRPAALMQAIGGALKGLTTRPKPLPQGVPRNRLVVWRLVAVMIPRRGRDS